MKLILHMGKKKSPFWAKSAAAQPGFLPAVSQNSLLVMLLGECWEYPERKKELTAFSDLPARATSPAHTHPPHTSALHPHTIWTLNACLQCLNVIALATKYQTKSNVTRAFEPFLLLLLGVFSGCMESVPSCSRRCPPNRGTTGVLTLTFNNYKSVYSINTMKPHKTCTQTHTNTCWRSKHKPTKLHDTFQFHPTTQTMQNLNFLRRRTHFLHRRSQETPCENAKLHESG